MLNRNYIKHIQFLKRKKGRNESRLFVVEGLKSVEEAVKSNFEIKQLFCLKVYENRFEGSFEKITVSFEELKKISNLKEPNGVLAVCTMRSEDPKINYEQLLLMADGINDPGNLGTIIRLADWFGIAHIISSRDTVDFYNPKVIQSTMGSFTRVKVTYTDLESFLEKFPFTVFGTFLDGENIYTQCFPSKGIIILGNESHGISKKVEKWVTHRIAIPQWGNKTVESLNVAAAAAIALSEFRRGNYMRPLAGIDF